MILSYKRKNNHGPTKKAKQANVDKETPEDT